VTASGKCVADGVQKGDCHVGMICRFARTKNTRHPEERSDVRICWIKKEIATSA